MSGGEPHHLVFRRCAHDLNDRNVWVAHRAHLTRYAGEALPWPPALLGLIVLSRLSLRGADRYPLHVLFGVAMEL